MLRTGPRLAVVRITWAALSALPTKRLKHSIGAGNPASLRASRVGELVSKGQCSQLSGDLVGVAAPGALLVRPNWTGHFAGPTRESRGCWAPHLQRLLPTCLDRLRSCSFGRAARQDLALLDQI